MKVRYFLFGLLMIAFLDLQAQSSKEKVFEKLKSKFSNLQTISVDFNLLENKNISGNLTAKKGNKYIISISDRKIYCDGKTIWNFVPEGKNVLVSNYDSHSESASIEKIFFEFTKNFQPEKLYKAQSSYSSGSYILELLPKENQNNEITKIRIVLSSDFNSILQIIINRNYVEENWKISNLKLDAPIDDNKFKFKVPDGVELIDLR